MKLGLNKIFVIKEDNLFVIVFVIVLGIIYRLKLWYFNCVIKFLILGDFYVKI